MDRHVHSEILPIAYNSSLASSPQKSTSADSQMTSSLVQVIQTHNQVLMQHKELWGPKEPELCVTQFQGAPFTVSSSVKQLMLAIS